MRETEEADECQLFRSATEHRVLHERHRCHQQDEQVLVLLLNHASSKWKSSIIDVFSSFVTHRGHFEEMSAQYLMRVEMPLKTALEQSSMSLKCGGTYQGVLFEYYEVH